MSAEVPVAMDTSEDAPAPVQKSASLSRGPNRGGRGRNSASSSSTSSSSTRRPKRRVALLLSYCGTNYSGMQIQKNEENTVEGHLQRALIALGGISETNQDSLTKIGWARAARTDKGVHAVGSMVSFRLVMPEGSLEEAATTDSFVDRINEQLPFDIRVMSLYRTSKNFSSYHECSSRTYSYVLPSQAFVPPSTSTSSSADADSKSNGDSTRQAPPPFDPNFRISDDQIEDVDEILSMYLGTHSYHNFTKGFKDSDASTTRYIMSFHVREVFCWKGVEYLRVVVHGQSFIYNQIRKMIGLAVATARNCVRRDVYFPDRVFSRGVKLVIPLAPADGLYLDGLAFKSYNERMKRIGHEELTFDDAEDKIQNFRDTRIYPQICESDIENETFESWVQYVSLVEWENIDPQNDKKNFLENFRVAKEHAVQNGHKWARDSDMKKLIV